MTPDFTFGKHAGKTVEWVLFHDPGFIWTLIERKTPLPDPLRVRLDQLVRRASHLRIPGICKWCNTRPITRMIFTGDPGGGIGFVTLNCDLCGPTGSFRRIARVPGFNPEIFRKHDKTGAIFIIAAIKEAFFGSASKRLTQKQMEAFFDNPDNFVSF